MPPPSKARKAALQREERRRLEREANTNNESLQPIEAPVVEARPSQPRGGGGSRSSKWRDKNGKTKKSRAVWMQPSVLKFFSVSNGDDRDARGYRRLTQTRWLTDSRLVDTKQLGLNVRTPNKEARAGGAVRSPRGVRGHSSSTSSRTSSPSATLRSPRCGPMRRRHGSRNMQPATWVLRATR